LYGCEEEGSTARGHGKMARSRSAPYFEELDWGSTDLARRWVCWPSALCWYRGVGEAHRRAKLSAAINAIAWS